MQAPLHQPRVVKTGQEEKAQTKPSEGPGLHQYICGQAKSNSAPALSLRLNLWQVPDAQWALERQEGGWNQPALPREAKVLSPSLLLSLPLPCLFLVCFVFPHWRNMTEAPGEEKVPATNVPCPLHHPLAAAG